VYSTHPDFSHRFGAIVSGIAGQGMSGNVMTTKYGAAVYLSTVVTDAVLKAIICFHQDISSIDTAKSVLSATRHAGKNVEMEKEEYVLLNSELHPRGKRRSIDCATLPASASTVCPLIKKFSSWGRTGSVPGGKGAGSEEREHQEEASYERRIGGRFDGTYKLIRSIGCELHPEEWIDEWKIVRRYEDLPQDELEQRKVQSGLIKKYLGIQIENPNVLTCGQCALVCGPTIQESAKRLKLLREGGIVVPGKDGETLWSRPLRKPGNP